MPQSIEELISEGTEEVDRTTIHATIQPMNFNENFVSWMIIMRNNMNTIVCEHMFKTTSLLEYVISETQTPLKTK